MKIIKPKQTLISETCCTGCNLKRWGVFMNKPLGWVCNQYMKPIKVVREVPKRLAKCIKENG